MLTITRSDPEQDFFDILVIPLMTYLTFPLPFHVWWLTTVYILYTEAAGHTGARVYLTPCVVAPLQYIGMELILEDQYVFHAEWIIATELS